MISERLQMCGNDVCMYILAYGAAVLYPISTEYIILEPRLLIEYDN